MAIRLRVRKNRQIIVPLRFARATTGDLVASAPEVDDRGFAMGTRPGTWGSTDARGAMVSILEGDTVRVRVLREDIDDGVPLFVNSTNQSVAKIAGPAGPLGSDGIFQIEGVKDLKNIPVKIQVRLGGTGGPVLGELEPHIFQLRQLRVRCHLVTINGVPTNHTAQELVSFIQDTNVFWRNQGVEFLYDPAEIRLGSITGFKSPGTVTTDLDKQEFHEFSEVLNLKDKVTKDKPDPHAINIYFVRFGAEFIGLTFDKTTPRPRGFGVVVADQTLRKNLDPPFNIGNPRALAHELGHYLDSPLHSNEFEEGKSKGQNNIFSARRIMFSRADLKKDQPAYRRDVGYGPGAPGCLISVKDLSGDPTDGEVARNRLRALNPNE